MGANVANTWALSGAQAGSVNGTLSFTGMENLTGGTSTDVFQFSDAAGGFGVINGGTGTDTLDYSLVTGPVTVNLQTLTAPKLTSFTGIESLIGTAAVDTLVGANTSNTWNLTGVAQGSVWSTNFTSFENLNGGTTTDVFKFSDAASGFGTINGSGNASDTLDYSLVTGPVTVDLQAATASKLTAFLGIGTFIGSSSSADTFRGPNAATTWTMSGAGAGRAGASSFTSFENLAGGTGVDTLVGTNVTNTWALSGVQAGSLNGTLSFTGMENLTGGTSGDVFQFSDAASGFGVINGGAGTDMLDYSHSTGPVTVNLQTLTAPKLTSFTSVEWMVGTSPGDTLVGANVANTWTLISANSARLAARSSRRSRISRAGRQSTRWWGPT